MRSGHHVFSRYCLVLGWCNHHDPIGHVSNERFQMQAHMQANLPESYHVTGEWQVASK